MADTKISALPSASTPLTGTEVLPIVQGAANFKVSVADLTTGRALSATAITLTSGTANGVAYLDGSKVLTTGSALVFDGTNFGVGAASPSRFIDFEKNQNSGTVTRIGNTTSGTGAYSALQLSSSAATYFYNFSNGYTTSGKFAAGSTLLDAGGTGGLGINAESVGVILYVASTEQARLTSSGLEVKQSQLIGYSSYAGIGTNGLAVAGNLGVGTSSPAALLHLSSGNGTKAIWGTTRSFTVNRNWQVAVDEYAEGQFTITPSTTLGGTTFTTPAIRVDSSGNLGLGVAPSASNASTSFEMVNGSTLFARTVVPQFGLMVNAVGNWYEATYKTAAAANMYLLAGGQHQWYNAPSGTAGNPITFTQAMTLDASGNLLVGGTSSLGYRSQIFSATNGYTQALVQTSAFSSGNLSGTVYAGYYDGSSITDMASIRGGKENTTSGNYGGMLAFYTRPNGGGDTERARIDSSGNLLVGLTGTVSYLDGKINSSSSSAPAFCGKTSAGSGYYTNVAWNDATSGDNAFILFGTETTFTTRGSITYNRAGGLVAYNVTSDYRAKDITGPVVDSGALIDSVPVYMGKMKDATQERPMFIAHETPAYAHTGVKDAVDKDGKPVYQQMDASALIPVMWAEIQDLRKRLAAAGI